MVRGDYATLGSYKQDGNEEGISYKGKVKVGRLGAFADYFPWSQGFRFTAGLTFNQTQIDLKANFDTPQSATIGSDTVLVGPGDRFNVKAKFPAVTPFLGIGYGHHGNVNAPGWGFHADLGASFGKAKVSIDTNLVNEGRVSQADLDAETQELRDGVAKVTFIPQLSVGVSYRF